MPTKTVEDLELTTVPIDTIVPYWRNPRNATAADIAKVMRSIERYGYQNPIMVDKDRVIVTGHTRYMALRRLGWTEVPVLLCDLPPDLAKEYRILDNRAGEFTGWDREKLIRELMAFTDEGILGAFFPEVDLTFADRPLTVEDLALPPEPMPASTPAAVPSRMCTCPHCYHQFELPKKEIPA